MRHIIEHTEFDVYTFEELSPDAQENAIKWWQDQAASEPYHWWNDCFKALEEFCEIFNVNIQNYEVSAWGRSYVTLYLDRYDTSWGMGYSDDGVPGLSHVRLWKYLINNRDIDKLLTQDCPFTGLWIDESLLEPIRQFMRTPDHRTYAELVHDCVDAWVSDVVADMEWQSSEENARESIIANEYEFTENGEPYFD